MMLSVFPKNSELFGSLNQRLRTFWDAKGWIAMLIGLPFVLLWSALTVTGPWLNTLDRREWNCEVAAADPVIRDAGLRGGSSNAFVVVRTKNCGEVLVDGSTVSFDNLESVVASFEPGSQWIFKIGWYSRNIGIPIERRSPSSQEHHNLAE